jgi:hypothetical protein
VFCFVFIYLLFIFLSFLPFVLFFLLYFVGFRFKSSYTHTICIPIRSVSLSPLTQIIRDPQNAVDFVEALYGDGPFMNSLYNSLTDNGVLLTQVGEAISVGDISETYPGNFNYQRAQYESGLINQGFEVVMQYDEPRAGFDGIWSFYAAFKDDSIRERWLMNEAQIDLEIHKRSIRRTPRDEDEEGGGEMNSLFDVFDGPTMATYRYPSKAAQVIYCLRNPQPYGCVTDINNKDHHTPYGGEEDYRTSKERPYYEPSGFDPEIPNFSADNFMVDSSSSSNNNSNNSNSLVSRVTIPEKSYLMLEQSIHDVRIAPATSSIVDRSSSSSNEALSTIINPVKEFVSGDREGLSIPRRVSYNNEIPKHHPCLLLLLLSEFFSLFLFHVLDLITTIFCFVLFCFVSTFDKFDNINRETSIPHTVLIVDYFLS